jgi:hypothetical protein
MNKFETKKLGVYKDLINKSSIVLLYYLEEEVEKALDNYCRDNNITRKDISKIFLIDAPDVFTVICTPPK